ncbi:MAG TPA: glutathione S-transferase family protein [Cyanobacteria bacterium UBA9273]|nr:glutathione S-transferase family protein [Cyanobacteria bacterium UBA9273]
MSKVVIYSANVCPYAQRTRMVLLSKGIEFELIEIDLKSKPDWFTEISPFGKVPLLKHGENTVWESSVINEYLEEVFPDPPLLPFEPIRRALARIWIDFANTKFTPAFYKLLLTQEPQKQQEWFDELEKHLLFMENEGLSKRSADEPYWLGKSLSLVDLSFAPWFERWPVLEHYRGLSLPGSCTRLQEWWHRMQNCWVVQQTAHPPEFHIQQYSHYASNNASGITAQEMRRY